MFETMQYIWLAIILLTVIIETITVQMVSIWFVLGSGAALITSLFTDSISVQIFVFVLVTVISLVATRPFVKKVINFKKEDTNSGRFIGKDALVIEDINNEIGVGQVNVCGSIWTAKTIDGSVIKKGETVIVDSIKGVKLVVKPKK